MVAAVGGTLVLLVLVAGAIVIILLYRFVSKSQDTAESDDCVNDDDVQKDVDVTDYKASTSTTGLLVGSASSGDRTSSTRTSGASSGDRTSSRTSGASSGDKTSVVDHIPFNLTTDNNIAIQRDLPKNF